MVGESNKHVFLIQIDASTFAGFDIFEFEISKLDSITKNFLWKFSALLSTYVNYPIV